MSKRIIALLLCAVMLVSCLSACSSKKEKEGKEDPGAYITMYLTDNIYDFDPANAFYNADTRNVVSMMYDTLFTLNDDGKVEKSLVDEYEFMIDKRTGEYCMELRLNTVYWSNGTQLSADDVAFAWRRLLTATNSFAAASLLYDIKNARAVKEGEVSIDNVGIEATGITTMKITFEKEIDYDQFLLNLTSLATAPLLESYVSKNPDWAKKPSSMVTSGAYKLGKIIYKADEEAAKVVDAYAYQEDGSVKSKADNKVQTVNYFYLERNVYYYRDIERDKLDASVKNYRILVDCTKTPDELLAAYQAGQIFYMGNIPLSLRASNADYLAKEAEVSNALSTFVCYLNEYAIVDDGANGTTLFANAAVRRALSMVIDREAIAKEIVYAEAATGLVPTGVFNAAKYAKKDFRDEAASSLSTTAAPVADATALLTEAGITASKYSFSIKVAAYDDVHVKIAEMVQAAWVGLGFNVTVEKVQTIQNNDYLKEVADVPTDVCEDLFVEALQRNDYQVAAFDANAYSADAYSVLSNFANAFSGAGMEFLDGAQSADAAQLTTHSTGYVSMDYNILMEAIYYIPYFASIDSMNGSYLQTVKTKQPYIQTAKALAQNAAKIANSSKLVFDETFDETYATAKNRAAQINNVITVMQQAAFDIERSYSISGQTYAQKDAVAAAVNAARTAYNGVKNSTDKDAVSAIIPDIIAQIDVVIAVAGEANTAANAANPTTLYDLIAAVYTANGITPSTKTSDWSKQKAILLHKAEEMLLNDMPVIPVVFNKNAVLVSDQLSKVTSTYYIPSYFRKTKLKNFEDYTYTLVKINKETRAEISRETCSIFDEFPAIKWDMIGQEVVQEIVMN